MSDSSYSSVELLEEDVATDSELDNEQSRSPSLVLPGESAKDKYAQEQYREPEHLLTAPIPKKAGKKKKGKGARKAESSIEPAFVYSME